MMEGGLHEEASHQYGVGPSQRCPAKIKPAIAINLIILSSLY